MHEKREDEAIGGDFLERLESWMTPEEIAESDRKCEYEMAKIRRRRSRREKLHAILTFGRKKKAVS